MILSAVSLLGHLYDDPSAMSSTDNGVCGGVDSTESNGSISNRSKGRSKKKRERWEANDKLENILREALYVDSNCRRNVPDKIAPMREVSTADTLGMFKEENRGSSVFQEEFLRGLHEPSSPTTPVVTAPSPRMPSKRHSVSSRRSSAGDIVLPSTIDWVENMREPAHESKPNLRTLAENADLRGSMFSKHSSRHLMIKRSQRSMSIDTTSIQDRFASLFKHKAPKGIVMDSSSDIHSSTLLDEYISLETSTSRRNYVGRTVSLLYKTTSMVQAMKGVSESMLEDGIKTAVWETQKVMKAHCAAVYLYNAETKNLKLHSASKPNEVEPGILVDEDSPLYKVVVDGEAISLGLSNGLEKAALPSLGAKPLLAIPMRSRQRDIIGMLCVTFCPQEHKHVFSPENELFLRIMGTMSAGILENIKDYEKERVMRTRFNTLLNTTVSLSKETQLDMLMTKIQSQVKFLLKADRCTTFICDNDTKTLWSFITDTTGGMVKLSLKYGQGIVGSVAGNNSTLNIPDAYLDPRFNTSVDQATGYRTKSILCMPVHGYEESEPMAVIQVINKHDGGSFDDDDETMLNAFTAQAAMAIEKARLLEESKQAQATADRIMKSMAGTIISLSKDGLAEHISKTGLLNQFGFTKEMIMGEHYSKWLEGNEELCSQINRVLDTGIEHLGVDYTIVTPSSASSQEMVVNVTITPVTTPESITVVAKQMWRNIKNAIQGLHMEALRHENEFPRESTNCGELQKRFRSTYVSQKKWKKDESKKSGVVIMIEDVSEQKRVMNTLGRYMSPALANQLMSEEANAKLGGTRQKITVMFGDIRSFTKLTENLDAVEVVHLLNDYFHIAVGAIQDHEGILDKYIGDCFMAAFGVPFPHEDDSQRAVACALQISSGMNAFNETRVANGHDPIHYGIGINTDICISGNIGTEKRMEYTCIGDGVNVASRVESVSKQYGVRILITEETKKDLQDGYFIFRKIDVPVVVMGKSKPVNIYEVVAKTEDPIDPATLNMIREHELGVDFMHKCEFDQSEVHFQKALEFQDTKATRVLLSRLDVLKSDESMEFNGTWTLDTK